ncbi:MAG: lysophospholipid acyltransferase family protein [Treponema sp.]|nr:1-acyl-sn-glycerol-3-phosphate acyltransferase [Spirochaetia bacterium]MDD7534650.1 lysophospholipid acyltransferase family protein [Treponema sp.]MDY3723300.1 lysophospholipid acyltransferase family protein [Treponema sp.]MDY5759317.1 lysophospholipid acyltransferase family protein [Treponema sp.]MDY5817159.1 lysophospholipid acyltransferase family protein [Treponema sp.]
MSKKEEISYKSKLPKIKNVFTYPYFCISKIIAIISFGLGAVLLAIFVFPFIRLFTFHKKDFGIIARAYVSHTFRVFLGNLNICKTSLLKVDDKEAYRNIHGKIIIANHPSLLDFVYIMSLVPNSTCIVRGGLTHTPLRWVIKQAYITNTTDFNDVLVECKKLTDKGCNVIVFPEGTRSPRVGRNNYKKGAARIALYCNCDVLPLFIGGSDKYGLGKFDPLWSYNHVEPYLYDIKMLPVISIEQFKGLSEPIAAKHLTEEMEKVIRAAGDEYAKTYTGLTLNNY